MMKTLYLSRAQSRFWSAEMPVGDARGGPAYGERRDPVTAVIVIGAAVSAVGAMSQASSAADAATYNRQVASQNASIATQQGDADALQQRRVNELRMGSVRAGYGASGVSNEGSPLDVLSSSAAQAELDVQNIKYGASLKALGYSNTATLDQSRASAAQTNGLYGAAAAALTGGAKAYGSYTTGTGTPMPMAGNGQSPGDDLAQ